VTTKVPVDPMGAFPRRNVDGVVPPPVDRTDVADVAVATSALPAGFDGKCLKACLPSYDSNCSIKGSKQACITYLSL